MSSRSRIIIGTRKSRLALAQTQLVADAIGRTHPDLRVELHPIVTEGDIKLDKPLPQIGGKGLFTFELEQALRSGRIDLAVHSAKDLPTGVSPDLDILCVPPRAPVNDVLVSNVNAAVANLPAGARIGTSSLRRQLQLRAIRPDLRFADIRGNIDTRVQKVRAGEYDAVILAQAGLIRAGMADVDYAVLPVDLVLPAPGQAALAIQGRAADDWLREVLLPISDAVAATCLAVERALLERLALDCQMPFAALCEPAEGGWRLRTWLADPQTSRSIRTDFVAVTHEQAIGDAIERIYAGGSDIVESLRRQV